MQQEYYAVSCHTAEVQDSIREASQQPRYRSTVQIMTGLNASRRVHMPGPGGDGTQDLVGWHVLKAPDAGAAQSVASEL